MLKWNGAMLMLAAGVLIGLIAVSQVKGAIAPNVQRAQDLSGVVGKLEQENDALQSRVDELSGQLAVYENSLIDNGELTDSILASLELARMEAGLIPLAGPGLMVELDNLMASTGQVVMSIQDEDLLAIINELNAAGAEAISINGERIVSMSEIRLAGNHININTRAQAAPFTILAIGNPQTLSAAMHLHGGVIDTFSQIARINTQMVERLEIPAYQGIITFHFAQAAEREG